MSNYQLDLAVSIAREKMGKSALNFHDACTLASEQTGEGVSVIARKIVGCTPMTGDEAAVALRDQKCISVSSDENSTFYVLSCGWVYEERWMNGEVTWTRLFPPMVKP
jgi:hypothetical protein